MVDFSVLVDKEVLFHNRMYYNCENVVGDFAFISIKGINGTPRGFEVWKLRNVTPFMKYPNKFKVRFPANSEFGTYGWSYKTEEAALEKFKELIGE